MENAYGQLLPGGRRAAPRKGSLLQIGKLARHPLSGYIYFFYFRVGVDSSAGRQDHHGLGSDPPEGRVRPANRPLPTAMVLGRVPIGCSPRNSTSVLRLLQNTVRHKSPDPRRSGTPCVLRLAFYLGTMLSVVLRIPGLRGGEFTPDTGAIFCGGCSNQRDYGMRCNPPSRLR